MDGLYLVWDASDAEGGRLDSNGNVQVEPRTVFVRDSREEACSYANEFFLVERVSKLVIELKPDGRHSMVAYIGVLEGTLLQDYGVFYSWMEHEAQRAVKAAVVQMMAKAKEGRH